MDRLIRSLSSTISSLVALKNLLKDSEVIGIATALVAKFPKFRWVCFEHSGAKFVVNPVTLTVFKSKSFLVDTPRVLDIRGLKFTRSARPNAWNVDYCGVRILSHAERL